MNNSMDDVLKNIIDRHSTFQLEHFVVGREYTMQGKMWQCLREIKTRKAAVEAYGADAEEAKDRIALLHIERDRNSLRLSDLLRVERNENLRRLAVAETEVKNRQFDRQVKALEAQVGVLAGKAADAGEEAEFFAKTFRGLNETEPVRSVDDLEAQKEYWAAKLFHEVNTRMLLRMPLDPEVVKLILVLDDDSPLKQSMVRVLEDAQERTNGPTPQQP